MMKRRHSASLQSVAAMMAAVFLTAFGSPAAATVSVTVHAPPPPPPLSLFTAELGFEYTGRRFGHFSLTPTATQGEGGAFGTLVFTVNGGNSAQDTLFPAGDTAGVTVTASSIPASLAGDGLEEVVARAAVLATGGRGRSAATFDSRRLRITDGVRVTDVGGAVARGSLGPVRFGIWGTQYSDGAVALANFKTNDALAVPYFHGDGTVTTGSPVGATGNAVYTGRTVGLVAARGGTSTGHGVYGVGGAAGLRVDFRNTGSGVALTLTELMVQFRCFTAMPWYDTITFGSLGVDANGRIVARDSTNVSASGGNDRSDGHLNFAGEAIVGNITAQLFGSNVSRGAATGPGYGAGVFRLSESVGGNGGVIFSGAFGVSLSGAEAPPPPRPRLPLSDFFLGDGLDFGRDGLDLGRVDEGVPRSREEFTSFRAVAVAGDDPTAIGSLGTLRLTNFQRAPDSTPTTLTLTVSGNAASASGPGLEDIVARAALLGGDGAVSGATAAFDAQSFADPDFGATGSGYVGGGVVRGAAGSAHFGVWGVQYSDSNGQGITLFAPYYHGEQVAGSGGINAFSDMASGMVRYRGRTVGIVGAGAAEVESNHYALGGDAILDVDFTSLRGDFATLTLSNLVVRGASGEAMDWYERITFPAVRRLGERFEGRSADVSIDAGSGDSLAGENLAFVNVIIGEVQGHFFGGSTTLNGATASAESAGIWILNNVGNNVEQRRGVRAVGGFGVFLSEGTPPPAADIAYRGESGFGGMVEVSDVGVEGNVLSTLMASVPGGVLLERQEGVAISDSAPAVLGSFRELSDRVMVRAEAASATGGVNAGIVSAGGGLVYGGYGVWGMALPESGGGVVYVIPYAHGEEEGTLTPSSQVPVSGNATYNGGALGIAGSYAVAGAASLAADFDDRTVTLTLTDMNIRRGAAPVAGWRERLLFAEAAISGNAFSGSGEIAGGDEGSVEGQFFGPLAVEAVGLWRVGGEKEVEAFGSFGVAR